MSKSFAKQRWLFLFPAFIIRNVLSTLDKRPSIHFTVCSKVVTNNTFHSFFCVLWGHGRNQNNSTDDGFICSHMPKFSTLQNWLKSPGIKSDTLHWFSNCMKLKVISYKTKITYCTVVLLFSACTASQQPCKQCICLHPWRCKKQMAQDSHVRSQSTVCNTISLLSEMLNIFTRGNLTHWGAV